MNEKIRDFFKQNIGYFIVALVSIVYIATAFITVDETGKTIGEIIADTAVVFFLGLHSINLDSIKGEIKYKYDRDNSAYLLWGKRRGEKGIGVDTIPQILEEQGIHIDAINEADIFFEIDAQYRNAVKSLKKKAKDMLSETRLESEGLVSIPTLFVVSSPISI